MRISELNSKPVARHGHTIAATIVYVFDEQVAQLNTFTLFFPPFVWWICWKAVEMFLDRGRTGL